MRTIRIQLLAKVLLPLLVVILSALPGYAASLPGAKCTQLGQVITSGGQKLTCSLIWTATSPKVAPTKAASKSARLQDKSFRLESVSFNTDLGSAGANARVTNISNRTKTASLGISIFASDGVTVLANLFGSANAVAPGQTITVTFMSVNGELPSGQFKYSFQVSAEF